MTVNYSVTLKLLVKYIKLLQRQHILTRLFLAFLMYLSPDRCEKTYKIQWVYIRMLCHISVVVNLSFGSRCFKRCVTLRRLKLQAAVNYANLFNHALNYE